MSSTVFSAVDQIFSHIKPIDSLINTVTARLLPRQEAQALGCPSGTTYDQWACGDYCRPTGDLYYSILYFCGYTTSSGDHADQIITHCCDCCN